MDTVYYCRISKTDVFYIYLHIVKVGKAVPYRPGEAQGVPGN